MAGSFHDSALGSSSGSTTCSTSDALTVTAGDLVWAHVKWETNAATVTVDTGAATPGFTIANPKFGTPFSSASFYWIATSTTTITPRAVFSEASDFNTIRAISVTPAGGTQLVLADTAAAEGSSSTPSSGAATAGAAGASFAGYGCFSSVTHTEGSGWTEPAEFEGSLAAHAAYQMQTGGGSITANGSFSGAVEWIAFADVFDEENTATLEQEGFRWGVDDANEASHTFEASQDTDITIADNQSRLLRVLVDSPDNPDPLAYTLRYQKNGSGGYVAVPVGSTTETTPVIEAGDATESGNNTASTSWAVSHPAAATGDLLIFCISWDDSTTTTDVAEPAGANGETLTEINATPATDAGTNIRCKCWYTVATGAWSATTKTFTPTASEQWTGACIKVLAGEFDAGTPIGASDTEGGASAGTSVNHGSFSAGGSDGGGKLCVWTAVDTNPQTGAAGFSVVCNEDRGAVSGAFMVRDTAVTDSESFSATAVTTITSEDWATVAFVVRAPTVNNEVYVTTSANITAGGEATTARLTAPSGKTTSDFTTGRRWDDENGTDTIDIAADFYTEVEWLVFIAASASDGDDFDFRVYAGTTALNTYTVTPRWTIASSEDMAAAGTLSITGAADLDARGTLAATGALSITGAADLDARGVLSAAGALSISGAADLDARGVLAAAGALSITGTADLDAIGILSAAGLLAINGAASLTSGDEIDISAAGSLSITGSADLDAIGVLAAAGLLTIAGAADLTDLVNDLQASGLLQIIGSAAVLTSGGTAPIPDQVFQTPAGRKKKKRYEVEIDGKVFPVDSYAEAERLLMRARDLAKVAAPEAVKKATIKARRKKRPAAVNVPIVSTPDPELQSLVNEYSASIEAIYAELARDAEIRQLLRRKLAEEADEEESILLLLH